MLRALATWSFNKLRGCPKKAQHVQHFITWKFNFMKGWMLGGPSHTRMFSYCNSWHHPRYFFSVFIRGSTVSMFFFLIPSRNLKAFSCRPSNLSSVQKPEAETTYLPCRDFFGGGRKPWCIIFRWLFGTRIIEVKSYPATMGANNENTYSNTIFFGRVFWSNTIDSIENPIDQSGFHLKCHGFSAVVVFHSVFKYGSVLVNWSIFFFYKTLNSGGSKWWDMKPIERLPIIN